MSVPDVPVIDFSVYSLTKDGIPNDEELQGVVSEIGTALKEYQCFWLKNSGFDLDIIRNIFKRSKEFYSLPYDKKIEYVGKDVTLPTGYFPDSAGNRWKPGSDVGKQGFHYCPLQVNKKWPEETLVPGFLETYNKYWNDSSDLTLRIAECISMSLGMDRNTLGDLTMKGLKDRKPEGEENWTTTRVNMYDPIPENCEGQFRFASHSDWTIFTLLYATCDGLMMQMNDESWVPVGCKEDAILVQSGFVIEAYSGGKIKANRHRVDVPDNLDERAKTRFSVVHFVYGDSNVPLTTLEKLAAKEEDGDAKIMGDLLIELLTAYVNSGNADHEKHAEQ